VALVLAGLVLALEAVVLAVVVVVLLLLLLLPEAPGPSAPLCQWAAENVGEQEGCVLSKLWEGN
jgi:hypothetical protein